MSTNGGFSKRILEILSKKKAISMHDIGNDISLEMVEKDPKKAKNGLSRSLNDLEKGGYLERLEGEQSDFLRLTPKGRQRTNNFKLESKNSLVSPKWDGKWRIVLLDLPESRKDERESLRYLLKKAGFVCLKNSAWISPYPFEFLFENIKKDLGLTTELMIIVSDEIDETTRKEIFKMFGK